MAQRAKTQLRRIRDQLLKAIFFATHEKRRIHGILCVVSDVSVPREELLSRLGAVFEDLQRLDPRRWSGFKRLVKHVIVWPGDYTAYDRWNGVHLSAAYLLKAPTIILAGGMVHEAAHLRIARAGVSYEPSVRARIEARCVREEADFLRRIPEDGERLACDAERQLSTPWWTEEMRRERVVRLARDADIPEWVSKLLMRGAGGSGTRE